MSGKAGPPVSPEDFERAAQALLAALRAAQRPDAAFPARLEAGLLAALTRLDGDCRLAQVLLSEAPQLLALRCRWAYRYGDLIRAAAAADPGLPPHPAFLESHLIAGIAWRLGQALREPGERSLANLLPSLLEFVLLYYFEPAEVGRNVAACWSSAGSPPAAPK